MWIVCLADDSHVMPSIISSENYVEHALKILSASRDRQELEIWLQNLLVQYWVLQKGQNRPNHIPCSG